MMSIECKDYISSWCGVKITNPSRTLLYQKYFEWCEENGEKPFSNNIIEKKFSDIDIESKQARTGDGKREWQYIFDRPKIVAKLCESDLGDIEEFSDIPQPDLPENETIDILIFNVSEIIHPKLILPQPEENLPPRDKKADKQNELTQLLFNYVAKDTRALIISTSGTSKTSKTPESVIDDLETSKHPKSIEPICEVVNTPPKEINVKRDLPKTVKFGEDPDVFITITKKDRLDFITFCDRMETDSRMCGYAKEVEENLNEYMDMMIRERLIGEEIICHSLKEDRVTSSWLNTDEKW
ncbi:hypothetical protein GLOIN_2v1789093 [Rhizophagus clarus]|uniref:DNA primase/nucleoside triphosphatase C-terminal domain-containing protein n=1 Tax=Rhizophagus clarus TaxID=94130 RepID=A0A8H3QJ60_9GLOM|nr:hypothetical protein GLOIN_2v1789093 [Rhizophagus clarus]